MTLLPGATSLADNERISLEKPPEHAVGRFAPEIVPLNHTTSHAAAPISKAMAAYNTSALRSQHSTL